MAGSVQSERLQVLDERGALVADAQLTLDDDELLRLHRLLVRARVFDERALALQRSGWLRSYYQASGQEASTAAALVLRPQDWLFAAYREPGMWLAKGVPVAAVLGQWKGLLHDGWDPTRWRVTRLNTTIGTHLPHATGAAYANRVLGTDHVTMAVFGDGGTSVADFHAGLNFAGVWRTPTIFFCQNNLYAEATPLAQQTAATSIAGKAQAYGIAGVQVDGMDPLAVHAATREAVARAVAGGGPTLIESLTYRFAPHSSYDGRAVYRTVEEEDEWRTRDPLIRMRAFLAGRGVDVGSVEEQATKELLAEIDEAVEEVDRIAAGPAPFAALARSTYRTAPPGLARRLRDDAAVLGVPVGDLPETEVPPERRPGGETRRQTIVQAIRETFERELAARPEMVVLGEDVATEGGVFRATQGLLATYGPDRIIDTPLSENGIIGSAVGMAMAGLRPVAEIMFAGFSYIALDQIIGHVARMRWRTRGAVPLPVVIRMAAGGGYGGLEFHADSPEAVFLHNPGLTVVYPSTAYDAKGLLAAALAGDDPVVMFEPLVRYHVAEDGVPVAPYTVPIGRGVVRRPGRDITIVSYGNAVHTAVEAAAQLAAEGTEAEVVDLRTLYPWDEELVLDSVRRTGRLVTVHESPLTAGVGAEIAATVAERAIHHLDAPIARVGHPHTPWTPGGLHEELSLVSPQRIAAAVRGVLREV
jgi:2-oxoisovalerate dehydrogenase E1 component